MAIPHWTAPTAPSTPEPARLDEVSSAFGVLSNPTRLAILVSVATERAPVPYTELQAAVGVDDNGRLNYHLRQLEDGFLERTRRGYVLTDRGERAVSMLADV